MSAPRAPPRPDSDDSSDSEDEKPKVISRGARGPVAKKGPSAGSDDSDSDSDDDGAAKLPSRRQAPAAESDESDSEDDDDDGDDASTSGDDAPAQRRQVKLWQPINYDDMTQDEFYAMLKDKTRSARQEEKRMAETQVHETEADEVEPLEAFIDDNTLGYTYGEMLQRVYAELRQNNPELGDGALKKVKLPVPKTEKSGTKTTALTNFRDMCRAMNRDMEHVKDFIEKELTTSSSIDARKCLIIKIRNVKNVQIEGVFQKYVEEYCQCGNCGGIDTALDRSPVTRLWTLKCKSCKAFRTVQTAAGATYKAQIGRRPRKF